MYFWNMNFNCDVLQRLAPITPVCSLINYSAFLLKIRHFIQEKLDVSSGNMRLIFVNETTKSIRFVDLIHIRIESDPQKTREVKIKILCKCSMFVENLSRL